MMRERAVGAVNSGRSSRTITLRVPAGHGFG